jgi:MerR family transcriptional regulator, light-induced transcriptional regulator
MRALIGSGTSAAEAARLVLAGAGPPRASGAADGVAAGDLGRRLREALEGFDEGAANSILDEAISALSIEAVATRVVLPALEQVGDRWQRGEASVGQEHFATNVIRGRLAGLARNWGVGTGPLAILACPPGELHDIGLLVFGLVLRGRGWRIAYLGADTPIETVADAAERLRPRAVVLAALTEEPLRLAEGEIARLSGQTGVWLGGAGAGKALVSGAEAALLEGDPVAAAAQLATAD